jgi:hypothetical protein
MTEEEFMHELTKQYILDLEKRVRFWRLLGVLLSALTLIDLFAYH